MDYEKLLEEAIEMTHRVCDGGGSRQFWNRYRERWEVGTLAEKNENDPLFTFGVEYGILVAVGLLFGYSPAAVKKQ
jgi:hypothetical protein